MSKSKIKRSVIFPIILFVYLAVMAWIGRDNLTQGHTVRYCVIIGISLLIIVLLYFSLRKKEQLRDRREQEQYGTYADKSDTEDTSDNVEDETIK